MARIQEWHGFLPRDEDTVIEAAMLPYIRAKLDELAAGLAQGHAGIIGTDETTGAPVYDLEKGEQDARQALLESLVMWIETLFESGIYEVALIEHK